MMQVAENLLIGKQTSSLVEPHVESSNSISSASQQSWGWFPVLSLVSALGILILALANYLGRQDTPWADDMFWVGIVVMSLPIALRIVMENVSRRETIGLLIVAGIGFYLIKVLHSPIAFTYFDENSHWRALIEVIEHKHLFRNNPLLPITEFFPGQESVTAALMSVSGLHVFEAGLIIMAIARLICVLSLFLFYETISKSVRLSALATFLYMNNPNFVFFDSQFAYESLALPMAVLVLYSVAKRIQLEGSGIRGLSIVTLAALGMVIITHHVTSYALLAFLVLWMIVGWFSQRYMRGSEGPTSTVILAFVATIAWIVYIATITIGYLAPHLSDGIKELIRIISGDMVRRQLFRNYTGETPPFWEQFVGFTSVGLILLTMSIGILLCWIRHRRNLLALTLAIAALGFPASLALRLTQLGAEISGRSWEFLYLAIAFTVAIGAEAVILRWRTRWLRMGMFTVWIGILIVGGLVVGRPGWLRYPAAQYLVAGDARSIEPQGIEAANWARSYLGSDNTIATDRTNRMLMSTYGEQRPITNYNDKVCSLCLFFVKKIGDNEQRIIRNSNIRYIIVDRRLSSSLPTVGFYFEEGEPETFRRTTPFDIALLEKFDTTPEVKRIFDSGDIIIYDVGDVSNAP